MRIFIPGHQPPSNAHQPLVALLPGRDVVLDGFCHSLARLIVKSSEYSVREGEAAEGDVKTTTLDARLQFLLWLVSIPCGHL